MLRLDEILDQPLEKTQDEAYESWKQQIKALFLELIGEDDHIAPNAYPNALLERNQLRDELRQKVSKL